MNTHSEHLTSGMTEFKNSRIPETKFNRRGVRLCLKIVFSLAVWLLVIHTQAQVYIITTVLPPYSPDLSTYYSIRGNVIIHLQNTSNSTVSIKLGANFTGDNGASINTRPEVSPSAPIVLGPFASANVTPEQLAMLFSDGNLSFHNINEDRLLRTHLLPSGTYQLCIRAYDYKSPGYSVPLSDESVGCSNPFPVTYLETPEIISINGNVCGDNIDASTPQNIQIQWTIPAGAPPGTEYVFTMVEIIPDSRSPQDAMNASTGPPFFERTVTTPLIIIGPAEPILENGQRYAFKVQARNTMSGAYFENEGNSEVCSFRYGTGSTTGSGISLDEIYPYEGDYIPFSYFPIIVKYREYADNYNRFRSSYRLLASGIEVDQHDRDLGWYPSPLATQREVTGFPDMTQEQAQHIAVNKNQGEAPLPVYQRGVPYRWEADVIINRRGSTTDMNASTGANFHYGMSIPQPQLPENGAEVEAGDITLQFHTADPPSHLLPPFAIVQAWRATGPVFFNGLVDEKWVLEVSRQRDFSSILDTATGKVGKNFDLHTDDESAIIADLYKNVDRMYNYTDTGWYYWRIKWLTDPDGYDPSRYYQLSEVYRFHIGAGAAPPRRDSIPETPGDCISGCDADPILPSERVAVATAGIGAVVQIGKFNLTLTEITWSGTVARGRGTIRVPFFHAPMKVEFSDIQINAAGKVFSGDVTGMTDNSTLIPAGMARAAGTMTGMTNEEADALNTYVSQAGRLVSSLVGDTPMGLPIGLDNTIDGQMYTIAVVGLNFTPERATLNAIFSIDIPELHGWLSLGASDICFHPNGLAGLGRAMLYNPVDRVIPFTDEVQLIFKRTSLPADSGTFVRWDCDGFQELRIKGEFIFPRDWFIPDSVTGDEAAGNVKARFLTSVRRRGNWLASVDFDPFQIAGVPDWGFSVRDAVFDFSDISNAEGMVFPVGYAGDRDALWKGFFLKRVQVRLPSEFKTFDDPTHRLSFSVQNVLIDRTGLTGSLRAENIVNINEGNLADWGFSIDTIHIDMVSNSFSSAGMNGGIRIPVSETALNYDMILSRSVSDSFAYEFNIRPADTISAPIWAAQLDLLPTSRANITINSAGVMAMAELNGEISISGDLGILNDVNLSGMSFEGLRFQTRAPYISCRSMSFASPDHSAGGFPIGISNIDFTTRDGPGLTEGDRSPGPRAGIAFNLNLILTGESNTFHATTRLAVVGKLNLGSDHGQLWEFSGVVLDSVAVGGSVGVVSIEGALVFYSSHPVYGDGIKGYISATFRPTISVSATAQFGSVRGFNYWYVDAMAEFSPGVPLFAGLNLKGFGGAAFYHMSMSNPPSYESLTSSGGSSADGVGQSLTNAVYTPDNGALFGFNAKLLLGPPVGNAYKALVEFGATINTSGGISEMHLGGDLYVMTQSSTRSDAPIWAHLLISYDFEHNILDGNFEIYINVADGAIKGIDDGLAGWMHIYSSPDTWFIKIGEPDRRVGVNIANIFTCGSYFMVGLGLPGMPPLPEKIASVLDIRNQRNPDLSSGDGFAFGTYVDFNTGRLPFLMFYARFELELGFDLSVMNFGDATCDGMPPGSQIGIDGWYAQGQLYAYFEGSIGIFVDVWFVQGEFEILGIQAAAALRGGFPNPSWMVGNVGGRYNILGGLVQGQCNFEARIGEECSPPVENPLADVELVTDLSPADGANNVDCGVEPEAVFSLAPDRVFNVTVMNSSGEERIRTFRAKQSDFLLKKGSNSLAGRLTHSPDTLLYTFTPNDYLDPYSAYEVSVKAYMEEYGTFGGSSNQWRISTRNDGSEINKTYTHHFRTGAFPDHIRPGDVLYSYPFHNQRFFLQNECHTGILQLKASMSPVFNQPSTSPDMEWHYFAEFMPVEISAQGEGEFPRSELHVSGSAVTFDVPSLLNNTIYALRFVAKQEPLPGRGPRINTGALGTMAPGSAAATQASRLSSQLLIHNLIGGNTAKVKSTRIDATKVREGEKLLYVWYSKTSAYNNLAEKAQRLTAPDVNYVHLGNFEQLKIGLTADEPFDVFDINGFEYTRGAATEKVRPLVYTSAAWNSRWHTSFANPYIYDLYNNLRREHLTTASWGRNISITGAPPTMAMEFGSRSTIRNALNESEYLPQPPATSSGGRSAISGLGSMSPIPSGGFAISSTASSAFLTSRVEINYNPGLFVPLDFFRMRTICGNVVSIYGLNNSEFLPAYLKPLIRRVLYYGYTPMYHGSYGVNFHFRPPPQCMEPDDFRSTVKYALPVMY